MSSDVSSVGSRLRCSTSDIILILLVVGVWGVALLAPGSMYWDDWVQVGGDTAGVYSDLGIPWVGYVVGGLAVFGPIGFKLASLLSAVVVAVTARGIAAGGLGLNRSQTFVGAALVAVLPFNVARVSLAVLVTYSISLALFFLAWWLLVTPGRRHARRVAAAALLLVSFTTPSLIPFVAVPVAHLALLELDRSSGFWRGVLRFAGRNWYVLATPVVFWGARMTFLRPRGVYAESGYNTFVAWTWPLPTSAVLVILMLLALAVGTVLLLPAVFGRAASHRMDVVTGLVGGGGAIFLAALLWLGRGSTSPGAVVIPALLALAGSTVIATVHRSAARVGFLTSTGLVTFALGALPYLLVGKVPSFIDWETRHQLLLPIGTALLVLAALVALEHAGRGALARAAGYAAVAVSSVAVVISGLSLIVDWHKQEQIIAGVRDLADVRDASTVVFVDRTTSWNYGSRHLRFYEPIGWLHAAFRDSSRFALESSDLGSGSIDKLLTEGKRYGFSDWDPHGLTTGVLIRRRTDGSWWKLLVGRPAVEVSQHDFRTGDLAR